MLRAVSPVEIVLGLEGIGLDVLPQELHRDFVGDIRGGTGGVLRATCLVIRRRRAVRRVKHTGGQQHAHNAGSRRGRSEYRGVSRVPHTRNAPVVILELIQDPGFFIDGVHARPIRVHRNTRGFYRALLPSRHAPPFERSSRSRPPRGPRSGSRWSCNLLSRTFRSS